MRAVAGAVRAVVVGGGLAGLAAALDLVDAGHDVTLLEARPTLGGAVQTLPEREGDPAPPPDNGQHIALGCCTEYLRFLERDRAGRVGAARAARAARDRRGRARGADRAGRARRFSATGMSLRERLGDRAGRSAARRKLDPAAHDGETFAALLRRLGQSQAAIDRFWDVFIRPALNLRAEEASAAPAIFTVQTALLGGREASDVLLPIAPLGAMHGEAAGRAAGAAGADVRTRRRVVGARGRTRSCSRTADGSRPTSSSSPCRPRRAPRCSASPDPGLEDSPIVSVHLLFDRPILGFALAALLGSPAHWVFDRGR